MYKNQYKLMYKNLLQITDSVITDAKVGYQKVFILREVSLRNSLSI